MGKDRTVFIKDGDKYRWLVLDPKGTSGMEVCQTDTHGRITVRDTYESVRNVIRCTSIERLCADGRGIVRFTDDEAGLINMFGGNGREDTTANIVSAVKDKGAAGRNENHEMKVQKKENGKRRDRVMMRQESRNGKLQKGKDRMIVNVDGNSRALEDAIKNAEQAKARLANERKKQNERRRKAENRHKYMMGGIIVKYFPQCYRFEESELNRILSVALATRECRRVVDEIVQAAGMQEVEKVKVAAEDA